MDQTAAIGWRGNARTETGDETSRTLGWPAGGPRGSMIYLDSSVALAHLLAEDRWRGAHPRENGRSAPGHASLSLQVGQQLSGLTDECLGLPALLDLLPGEHPMLHGILIASWSTRSGRPAVRPTALFAAGPPAIGTGGRRTGLAPQRGLRVSGPCCAGG